MFGQVCARCVHCLSVSSALSLCLSLSVCLCLSVCLSIYLFIYLSVCLSACRKQTKRTNKQTERKKERKTDRHLSVFYRPFVFLPVWSSICLSQSMRTAHIEAKEILVQQQQQQQYPPQQAPLVLQPYGQPLAGNHPYSTHSPAHSHTHDSNVHWSENESDVLPKQANPTLVCVGPLPLLVPPFLLRLLYWLCRLLSLLPARSLSGTVMLSISGEVSFLFGRTIIDAATIEFQHRTMFVRNLTMPIHTASGFSALVMCSM
jgi:hypothetical protein